jgi:hypothetical protein
MSVSSMPHFQFSIEATFILTQGDPEVELSLITVNSTELNQKVMDYEREGAFLNLIPDMMDEDLDKPERWMRYI